MDAPARGTRMGAMDYSNFLDILLGAGNRLPQAMPLMSEGIQDYVNGTQKFEQAIEIIAGNSPTVTLLKSTPAFPKVGTPFRVPKIALDKEKQVVALLRMVQKAPHLTDDHVERFGAGEKAIGDGQLIQLIRTMFQFLMANPQFLQMLLALFSQPAPTPAVQV